MTTLLATVSLQDGRHTLRVDAEDTAVPTPNAATATLVFLLDEIAPLAQIDSIEALPDGVVNSVDIPGTILAAGSIEIRGTVVDSIALERVDLRVDGVLFGTDRSVNGRTGAQQVRFTLDTDALADGDHVITLEAVDQAGNVGVSLPEEIETDNTRPDVRILLPAPGQVVRGDGAGVEFDVQVVEPNLRRVTLRVGGTVIREENFPRPGMPLQFVTQIRVRAPIPQGRDLVLTVDAGDLVNNAAPTANRIFTSDTEDPQGAVLTITPNGTAEDVVSTGLEPPVVRGRIRVGARATDSLQIRTIQLLVDGIPVAAMESGPGVETVRDVTFILDTSTLIEGRHTLRLLVTDTALRTNVAQVGGAREILVDRSAPSSILLEPLTEQVRGAVDAGGRVRLNITGRVRDNTGPIVAGNVRMTLMGTVGGAPQTVVLAPVLRPTSAGSTTEFDVIAEGVDITAFQEGALVIELQVTDAVGLTSTGQRRVILNRAGPTVDFRNPDGMQRFLGNSVQRVQFRLNDTTTLPGVGGGAAQPDRLSIANIRVLIFELRQARSGGSFQRGNRV
ncbi:MAG: hypothetical protein FJX77_15545, partial [Armatimonadetes bacterium]|nr:hypothetical protein [Armatimonadota bacterium]